MLIFLLLREAPASLTRRALRRIDPAASAGAAVVAPGILLISDVMLPSRGFHAGEVYAWWHIEGLRPVIDSLLVPACTLEAFPGREGGRGGGSGGHDLPPTRIGRALVVHGSDTTFFSGTACSSGSDRMLSGTASGRWGSAVIRIEGLPGGDSLSAEFIRCSSIPDGLTGPSCSFRGLLLSGSVEGRLAGDSLTLSGRVAGLDGGGAVLPFSLRAGRSSGSVVLETDVSGTGGTVEAAVRLLDPGACVSSRPSGTVRVTYDGGDSCLFEVSARLDSTVLSSARIASDTVFVPSCSLGMRGTAGPRGVTVEEGLLLLGRLPLFFSVDLPGASRVVDLRVWSTRIRGEDLAASVPSALLGPLEGLSLTGEMSFEILLHADADVPESSDVSVDIDVSGLGVGYSPVAVGRYAYGGGVRMRDSWGGSRWIELDPALNDSFVRLSEMPPWFEPILCCAEDGSFRRHHGFSLDHIRGSLVDDLRAGRFVRGGSTITMQLARNLFLSRERTLARKLQEVFLTWRLESALSKDRILEIYANIVELGPGVFGFDQGARYYFGVGASGMGIRETAFLVSILPGPRIYHRFFERGEVPGWWEDYLDRLILYARNRGGIGQAEAEGAMGARVRFR